MAFFHFDYFYTKHLYIWHDTIDIVIVCVRGTSAIIQHGRCEKMEEKKDILHPLRMLEAGKFAYQCKKCGTNMILWPEQPKICGCGSTDLKQLSKQELEQILDEDR